MRFAPRAILAAGLGFAASFVVACGGGSGLLSGDQSDALSGQADHVVSAVQSGNCGAAVNASAVLGSDVQNLPATVNSTLRSNLTQGASTIAELARTDCHHHTAAPKSATTSTSTTTTTPTSTSTSTTTTTPTTTTSTSTTSTSATTPTDTGTTSTTTGGVGLGGGTTTDTGNGGDNGNDNGSGGAGPGQGDNNGTGGGG